ncbi:RnfH family protein [Thiohalorhabdus sp.]|uniref:RnfH family protein n=1 Tax=Thiohalorhabdus sp. TaxID=3094134 RepID=UPI002FC39483
MQISVAYAEPDHQEWIEFEVPEGITAEEAVTMSGILDKFPQLDINDKKLGVFGKPVKREHPLREGDRVEIYRALKADPKKARTRKRHHSDAEDSEGEGAASGEAGTDQDSSGE